jgi:Tfp pilus assembly protein FimT
MVELALLALVLVFAAMALWSALDWKKAQARVKALEKELVQARSAQVLAQAREWEFHRESGKAREMD